MLSLCTLRHSTASASLVRCISTSSTTLNSTTGHRPWFVSDRKPSPVNEDHTLPSQSGDLEPRPVIIHPPPQDAPPHLLSLYDHLKTLPYLDPTRLLVTRPKEPPMYGPNSPSRLPRGRRLRGGTDHGEGFGFPTGTLWDWLLIAQVKEGTEGRGSIYLISKICREKLLGHFPRDPLLLKGVSKGNADWSMLDVNQTAVHIVSKDAREKWFGHLYNSET